MTHSRQSGFTLVELAVVLSIVGLIVAGAMVMLKPTIEYAEINATRQKQKNISDSLALFVQNYGRLPCPAQPNPGATEPFGAPRGSGVNGINVTAACGAQAIPADFIGIVPFRALGLDEDNVRDGYGNLMTFAVSPVMAGLTTGTITDVNEACRRPDWYDPPNYTAGATATNLNPAKASVCCPRFVANSDLIVLDGLGSANSVFTQTHGNVGYANRNTVFGTATPNANTDLIAYVLVSHGSNGDGAYIARSANRNPITIANAGAQESENRTLTDRTFVDRAMSKANDANYFDDIVLWETNRQLIGHFGNDSCVKP